LLTPPRPYAAAMGAFTYRLLDEYHLVLGELISPNRVVEPGERLARGENEELEVVKVVAADDSDEVHAHLIVRSRPGV
jgi:hypothetical protein